MGCGIVVNQVWAGRAADGVDYRAGSIDKQDLLKSNSGAASLVSVDAGQAIGETTAPFDALMLVLEGRATITVDGAAHDLSVGDMILIPAHRPHAVEAPERFKMVMATLRA